MSTPGSSSQSLSTTVDMTDDFKRLFPREWQELPTWKDLRTHQLVGAETKYYSAKYVGYYCAGSKPTDEEILSLVSEVKKIGEPAAFFVRLCNLDVVDFPKDDDTTVKEFFEGKADPSKLGTRTLLIVYPFFEEA
jgi:hypothetical protein